MHVKEGYGCFQGFHFIGPDLGMVLRESPFQKIGKAIGQATWFDEETGKTTSFAGIGFQIDEAKTKRQEANDIELK